MMKNTAQTLESSLPTQGPGDRLQAARISIGMTLEDVANRMHLSESILSSLEENNFDDITAPIFVKGYLRAYARIVQVNEEDIIEQYNQYYTEGDPPIQSTSNAAPEINADDARVKWVTWLVIIGLVALLTAWWWNRYQQPAQPLSLDSTEQPPTPDSTPQQNIRITQAPAPSSPAQAELQDKVQQDLAQLAQQASEPAMQQQPVTDATVTDPSSETADPSAATADLPADVDSMLADSSEVAAPLAEQPPAPLEQPAADSSTAASPAAAEEGLVIVVNADTWANITDADGKRLVRDLLRAGRTVRVDGKAPLQVFLGNGYGVSMTYRGEDIDISSDIRSNNTAKVSIGR